ncbi:ParA family protein [Xanthomonas campestris pv. zinniae]|uniref:ParA family protein n=1 Tax=Xanthomonas cannabis TaxID=1885674 RepID=UPI001E54D2EC|nr:ParA family protein [Xanthomonas campestris pv. zinniae]
MGSVVTVMNMKGGVGKTTVSMHLAGALSRYVWKGQKYRKILLVDYDAQFNLSQAYLSATQYFSLEKSGKTILAVLQDDDADLDPYKLQVPGNISPPAVGSLAHTIYKNKTSQLDIIPSTLNLMYVALGRADVQVKPIEERFEKFITECRKQYDLVLIDCHPAGSLLTKTSLSNSDHVIIPVAPERYAVRGIGLMMNFISAKKQGSSGPAPHIIFNKMPRTGFSKEEVSIRANPKYAGFCLKNTLKRYSAFSDPEEGKGFVWDSGKPYSYEATRNLQSVAAEFASIVGI